MKVKDFINEGKKYISTKRSVNITQRKRVERLFKAIEKLDPTTEELEAVHKLDEKRRKEGQLKKRNRFDVYNTDSEKFVKSYPSYKKALESVSLNPSKYYIKGVKPDIGKSFPK